MTHVSSYRYGPSYVDAPSNARSSEVRVSYFDPVTGKPCAKKPVPRSKQVEPKPTAYEHHARRKAAEAEAAEISRKMRERNEAKKKSPRGKGIRHGGKPKRPVFVDGVRFPSVTEAAEHIGTSAQHLGNVLCKGNDTCKGRRIAFAKEEE